MQACTKLICPGLFTENWRCNLQHSNRFKNRTLQIVNSMRDQFKVSGHWAEHSRNNQNFRGRGFNNNYIYRIWIYLVQVYTLDNIRNVIFCSSLKGYNQKAILHTSSWEVKPGLALIIHKIKQIHLLQNADFVFSDGCVCQGYILYFVYLHANL